MTVSDFRVPRALRPALLQMARVVCPREMGELGIADAVVGTMERQMQAFPTAFRAGLMAGLATLELSSVARFGRRFSRLDPVRAERWFHTWWHADAMVFRQLARALKALLVMGYWEQPVVREKMGFRPDPFIAEVAQRRLETYGAEIARHEAMVRAPDPLIPTRRLTRKVRHA